MKILSCIFCVAALAALPASAAQATKAKTKASTTTSTTTAKGPRTITITASEQMKWDVTSITAKPGETLHVVLKSTGSMPKVVMAHNFVLLSPAASPLEVNNAAFTARATDFIPESMKDKIIAHTGLAGGGETVEVTFDAPKKAGAYTYLCTFPGHFTQGMKGTLTVK
jgi:azurin